MCARGTRAVDPIDVDVIMWKRTRPEVEESWLVPAAEVSQPMWNERRWMWGWSEGLVRAAKVSVVPTDVG